MGKYGEENWKNMPPERENEQLTDWEIASFTDYKYRLFDEQDTNRGLMYSKTFWNESEAPPSLFNTIADGEPGEILPSILGKNEEGEIEFFDLVEKNTLVAGQTRSGKTNWLRGVIVSLLHFSHPEYSKVVILDPKAAAFKDFASICTFHTEYEGVIKCIKDLVTILRKRIRLTRRPGYPSDAKAANKVAYQIRKRRMVMPYITVVFDEFADFMAEARLNKQEDIITDIQKLASLGLGLGICLLFATQAPYKEYIKGVIKNNFERRISFNLGDIAQEQIILGKPKSDKQQSATSLKRGDFLIREGGDRRLYHALFVPDEALINAARNLKRGRYCYKLPKVVR